ncbi:uncharacterized protein Gasu_21140 [Galdieria sulphuraria]|uniref:Uncharacterized protein n=1 Tax=Galdieria sulphuraria TaxID=130081 RepID=M2W4H9_GALSU|nr:uncharacterized protein Gasu_21140 [Galdieria sulphuraria]EME30656.1 hypothetical protein Gasu_21140 [Galdieria sulphuraria]|eukprot:XP_005707176.1 hypothetical protein Gasu_21140 [Galdieria sulphuraria]
MLYSSSILFVNLFYVGNTFKTVICHTKSETSGLQRGHVHLNICASRRGRLECCSHESVSQLEDDNISRDETFVIPHEAFTFEGDLGEWTRAWEDHNFQPNNDGPLPHSLKGPSDNYSHAVSMEEFLANLSTLEPCEEEFVSYGDIFEPLDPEAIRRYQNLAQENGAYVVENMSNLLSPFRLVADNNETTKEAPDVIEWTDYHKLLDIFSLRKFYGWKYIYNAQGILLHKFACSFDIHSGDNMKYAFDIHCSTSEQRGYCQVTERVFLQSLVISPNLDAFSWIDSKQDETLCLFFGFVHESLTIIELEYEKHDTLRNICIWFGNDERNGLHSLDSLEMEALLGVWKGRGVTIQSSSFPCYSVTCESEWKSEPSNINNLTVRRNLPLKNAQSVDPCAKLNIQKGLKGERRAVHITDRQSL